MIFSLLRAAPLPSCCRQLLLSLLSAGDKSVMFHSEWVSLAEDLAFKAFQLNLDFSAVVISPAGEGYHLWKWKFRSQWCCFVRIFHLINLWKDLSGSPMGFLTEVGNSYWMGGTSFLGLTGNRKVMNFGSFIMGMLQLGKLNNHLLEQIQNLSCVLFIVIYRPSGLISYLCPWRI